MIKFINKKDVRKLDKLQWAYKIVKTPLGYLVFETQEEYEKCKKFGE